jgi:hypothetical protein
MAEIDRAGMVCFCGFVVVVVLALVLVEMLTVEWLVCMLG